jgi:hypothetical protein
MLKQFGCIKPELMMDLFIIPGDPICDHVVKYIRHNDAAAQFHVHDVSAADVRPLWLEGVPTVVCRQETSDGGFGPPEEHVGELALRCIRDRLDGTQPQDPRAALEPDHDPEDDLEVIEGGGGDGGQISTYDLADRRPLTEGQLLELLLPLPLSVTNAAGGSDRKATEDEISRAISERGRVFALDDTSVN